MITRLGHLGTVLEQDVHTVLYGFGTWLPYTDQDGNLTTAATTTYVETTVTDAIDDLDELGELDFQSHPMSKRRRYLVSPGPSCYAGLGSRRLIA